MSILGEKILSFITSHAKHELPKEGIIGGQCVAEAYFRIKNIPIYTRIKDIDIFCAKNHNKKDTRFKEFKKVPYHIVYSSSNVSLQFKERKDYMDEFSDVLNGELRETVKIFKNNYKIFNVFEIENLNIVNLYGKSNNNSLFLKTIIECFDINMVKIGVCLKTKMVYISNDFKEFIKNKQLEIIDKKNPFKSFLRYLVKTDYSKGIYFNTDYEANLIYSLLELGNKKKYFKSVSFDYYSKLNNSSKKTINKYFNIKIVEHSFLKKVKIPLNLQDPFPSNIDTINYNLNKMINESNYVEIFYPIIDYFIPNNQRLSNESIMNKIKQLYNLENILNYAATQDKKSIPEKLIRFKKKYNPYWNKKNIYILGINSFKTVYFTPKKRIFNPIIKENLSLLKKQKKIRENLYNQPFLNTKDFLEMLFSKSKTSLFYSFLMKIDTKQKKCSAIKNTLEFLSALLNENKHNRIKKILQLNIQSIKILTRHTSLVNKFNSLCLYKNKELNFQDFSSKILYVEKLDISLIGSFEKANIPTSLFLLDFSEFKEKIVSIKKSIDDSIIKIKRQEILKIDEKLLKYKTYQINQICNSYRLKEIGTEMKHCVGGYSNSLNSKKMLFFDIYTNENERRTLSVYIKTNVIMDYKNNTTQEIKKIKGIKLTFDQYKGKRNFLPSSSEIKEIKDFIVELQSNLNYEIYTTNEYYLKEFEIKKIRINKGVKN